jgi:hypothetical protein
MPLPVEAAARNCLYSTQQLLSTHLSLLRLPAAAAAAAAGMRPACAV